MSLKMLRVCLFAVVVSTNFVLVDFAQADFYKLDINLDINEGILDSKMILRYQNLSKEPLCEVRLRLDMNLDTADSTKILSVGTVDGRNLQWHYLPFKFAKMKSEKAQLAIILPQPLEYGKMVELRIDFQANSKRLIAKEMTILQDDPFQSFDAWYPKAMTKKDGRWSIDDDRPSFYDVTIELPVGHTIASTGQVVEEKLITNSRRILQLQAERVRGFTIYGSSYWKKYNRSTKGVKLSIYLPAEAKHWAEPMLDTTVDVIAFVRKEYGEFPTQHLDIVCPGSLNDQSQGASAACNIISIFLSNQLEEQYRWLIAHEVPHQYFGSTIGLHAETIGWTAIGLALMMEDHYMTNRGLDSPMRKIMGWAYFEAERRGYDTTLSQPLEGLLTAEAPWSFGWNMALRHGKAYAVCSMLRDLLGQEKFKDTIRKIIAERADTLISGADLINYCEKAIGESLDWFVADWVNGHMILDYAISGVKQTNKGWEVIITKVGTAGFPVIVEVKTKTGEKLRQRIDRRKENNRLYFATSDKLKSVVIDPDSACPDLDRSNNHWQKEDPKSNSQ